MTHRSRPEAPRATPSEALHIRDFADGDLEAVADLWRICGLVVPYNDPAADIAFCRAAPNAGLFVAQDDDTVVGTVMAGHDGHRGWIYYLAVAPARRGEGLGRRLVAHAERRLAELGVRKVNLMIREHNAGVRAFYERLGYEQSMRIVMTRWLDDVPTQIRPTGTDGSRGRR
ncbi:MAG: GNAT family acetyltransferase [Alphaproteobacteria bacterium]